MSTFPTKDLVTFVAHNQQRIGKATCQVNVGESCILKFNSMDGDILEVVKTADLIHVYESHTDVYSDTYNKELAECVRQLNKDPSKCTPGLFFNRLFPDGPFIKTTTLDIYKKPNSAPAVKLVDDLGMLGDEFVQLSGNITVKGQSNSECYAACVDVARAEFQSKGQSGATLHAMYDGHVTPCKIPCPNDAAIIV